MKLAVAMIVAVSCTASASRESPLPPASAATPAAKSHPDASAAREKISPAAERALIDGVRMVLRSGADDCSVSFETPAGSRTERLNMKPPCYFQRDIQGKNVRVVKVKKTTRILVGSSRPDPVVPADCDTAVRTIVVEGSRVHLSSFVQRFSMCGDARSQWDEKLYLVDD
jgi:hypothetical protein